ncbi:Branched-chain amino acid transport protein [Raineyella antarctica]|uniref:Branched-chain amino acid transport protein n=1 Tax=Raineyella antarctica TaxID=1577474 RepID=A0A1G6GFP5_9ACTN|nr:AzlD domain-containing protein [Raineyella antarctica]SDB80770.1 Branched-chain amino acid transport protein [Raineyella antarctica]
MSYLAASVLVMALVTYALRVVPLVLVRRRISNPWLLSFLHYVPFAVLTAMTIPAILLATSMWQSGLVGLAVAVVLALRGRSLMVVALAAAAAVWVTEYAAGQF